MVRASWIGMGCCCWCVLVHLVIMQYRQILMYEYSDHMQSPCWRPTLCVHRCLIWWYASLTKRMVMHDTECPYWDYVSLNKKNPTPWSHGNKHYWVHGKAKVCPYCLMNEWKCHSLLIYWMNTYCRVLDICKSFTTRVSWGSFFATIKVAKYNACLRK